MTEEFLAWAGLIPKRWAELQEKLRGWAVTERTPAGIMKAMLDDPLLGYREQVVLAYWLGYLQASVKLQMPINTQELMLKARMN
jgi:hypothetical protein